MNIPHFIMSKRQHRNIWYKKGRRANADEGWRGGEGGGGVYEPPILAAVICEQPLLAALSQ